MHARRALTGLLAAGLVAGAAVPALAHTELVSTSPARGATVRHLPATITLTFSEAPHSAVSAKVVDKAGKNHATRVRLNPRNARKLQISTTGDPTGKVTVTATVIAPDGDRQAVSFRFTVSRPRHAHR
jgi:methionine-rich copper-binding protein CopC